MNGSIESYPCCVPLIAEWPDTPYTCYQIQNSAVGECLESDFCRRAANQVSPCRMGPLGRTCAVPDGGCFECGPFDTPVFSDCCYEVVPGVIYQLIENTHIGVCSACGGWIPDADRPCGIPPEEPQCELAGEDRPAPSGLRWTTDLLATVAYGLDEELDADGYGVPLTDHLCRPEPPQQTELEACVHAGGEYVMLEDGDVYVEACSAPHVGRGVQSHRISYCTLQTAEEGSDELEEGCQYHVGAIHTPWWTEALLRSKTWLCGPVVE